MSFNPQNEVMRELLKEVCEIDSRETIFPDIALYDVQKKIRASGVLADEKHGDAFAPAREAELVRRRQAREERDARVMPIISQLRLKENAGFAQIADALNAMKIIPPAGQFWTKATVWRIYKRNQPLEDQ
jgi:hypothetical protein